MATIESTGASPGRPADQRRVTDLPPHSSALIGRHPEVARLRALLFDQHQQLVTITGPGGVGKTHLASHLAGIAASQAGLDAIFVALASLDDPAMVLPAIATAIGETAEGVDPVERVSTLLRDRPLLIVLDNFEQILGAATHLVILIGQLPALRLLVTSRSPLRVASEIAVPLAPLALPEPDDPTHQAPALRLFISRAREAAPAFQLTDTNSQAIIHLCRLLEGLPLSIELAAARVNSLGPAEMARILQRAHGSLDLLQHPSRDHDDRHYTIGQTVQWSVSLLGQSARTLFRHLGIFPASVSLVAIEAVMPLEGADLLTAVEELVESSLLRHDPLPDGTSRYLLPQPVRELAREQLDAAGESDAAAERLIAWALAFTQERQVAITTMQTGDWLLSVQREADTLRTATNEALNRNDPERALRIAGSTLFQYWGMRGLLLSEGTIVERAVAQAETAARPVASDVLATGYAALATRAMHSGDADTALRLYDKALPLRRQVNDLPGTARILNNYGLLLQDMGQPDRARAPLTESLTIRRATGDNRQIARALINLGDLELKQHRLTEAETYLAEVVALTEATGDFLFTGNALVTMAELALLTGTPTDALDLAEQGLALLRHIGEPRGIGQALEQLARASGALNQPVVAIQHLIEAFAVYYESSDRIWAIGILEVIACTLAERPPTVERRADIVRLLAATQVLRERINRAAPPAIRDLENQVRTALPGARFRIAWGEGHAIARGDLPAAVRRIAEHAVASAPTAPAPAPAIREPGDGRGTRASEHADRVVARFAAPARSLEIPLTAREREVLRLLIDGKSDRDIAADLFISTRTASNHVGKILQKLDVGSRTAAASVALRFGLVAFDDDGGRGQ